MKPSEQLDKLKKKAARERWHFHLRRDLKIDGLLEFEEEFKFHSERKWRFDFAFPDHKLAIECDGGVWMDYGGHQTGKGYQNDRYKDEAALLLGWIVYRVTPEMIKKGEVTKNIETLLSMRL